MIHSMTVSKNAESRDGARWGRLCERLRLLLGLITICLVPAGPAWAYHTEHVVLVIVDGLRYCDGLGDSGHTYVPEMYELSKQGSIVEPFVNDWITDTMHGIPTIWCGGHSELRTFSGSGCDGGEYTCSELPTVFEYYRKHLSRGKADCIYTLKDVNGPWRASLDPDHGPEYWPLAPATSMYGTKQRACWSNTTRHFFCFTSSAWITSGIRGVGPTTRGR